MRPLANYNQPVNREVVIKLKPLGLYLHVPFCLSKCPYCDFYSVPYSEAKANAYTQALLRTTVCLSEEGRPVVDTIYFGGGTPILLGRRLLDILEALKVVYKFSPDCEITVEANPAAMTLDTLTDLRKGGFNRISLGVQAANDTQLRKLGRLHNFQQAEESVDAARRAGFSNISVDLMLATPGQTKDDIDSFLDSFDRRVTHISCYMLTVEDGTPFARQHIETLCPDEDASTELYLYAAKVLEEHGFLQYEISNFSRPGLESRHNLKYWNCEEYQGFGPSAHSFRKGRRTYFPSDVEQFLSAPNPWDLVQVESDGGSFFEYAMLRLRLTEGLVLGEASKRYPGQDFSPILRRASELQSHDLVVAENGAVSLTRNGFLLSNQVIAKLLEDIDE